jgi:metal-sulfur cluster biosynthetic enzyme
VDFLDRSIRKAIEYFEKLKLRKTAFRKEVYPMKTSEELKEWIRPIEDPDIGMSLVDLGLIYEVAMNEDGIVNCKMTLTTPACPAAGYLVDQVKKRLEELPEVRHANVELVWEPKWDPKTMASDEAKEAMGIW